MAVAAQRRGVFLGMVTGAIGVAIALPFALIHPVLPFTLIFVGYGLLVLFQRWRWLPKDSMGYLVGCLAALVILLPAVFLFKFMEQGFKDGPFYGEDYSGVISGENASARMDYRQGELLTYNRQADKAPVLVYWADNDLRWAKELDVGENPRYEDYHLESIRDLALSYGIFRDRIDFEGRWSFGTESGRAYLWKWGGFHRFFLSW